MPPPIRLRANHVTVYEYEWPVSWASHVGHLTPRNRPFQTVIDSSIDISPSPTWTQQTTDFFGNNVYRFSLEDHHESLTVTARMTVEIAPPAPPEPEMTPAWEEVARLSLGSGAAELIEANSFLFASPHAPTTSEMARFARQSFQSGRPVLSGLLDLNYRIYKGFTFNAQATSVSTPVATVLNRRQGVCQDFAHLMIASLRSIGIPACYISGYIRTGNEAGEDLVGGDASHAWLSVYCGPEAGWIDIDPTNNCIPTTDHITVAWGRDFEDVSPLKGVILGGGRHDPEVGVVVEPVTAD